MQDRCHDGDLDLGVGVGHIIIIIIMILISTITITTITTKIASTIASTHHNTKEGLIVGSSSTKAPPV
jgi:hypothetical protein